MASVYKYAIWCTTDSQWYYEWAESAPSLCPEHNDSNITASKTYVAQQPSNECLKRPDGRMVVAPVAWPAGYTPTYPGVADDVTNGTPHGDSSFPLFHISSSSIETVTKTFQYIDPLDLKGAYLTWKGATGGDYIKYRIYAPATAGTSNEGAGAYDKYAIGGGINMYIPNGTTTGDWDLNLTEKLNANVDFTKVVPIPSPTSTGWFDYDYTDESVTFNSGQTGNCNLLDTEYTLFEYIPIMPLLGDHMLKLGESDLPAKTLYPHWKHEVKVYNHDTNQIDVVWFFYGVRL